MNRKLILKSPSIVPFVINLAQLEAKSAIPGMRSGVEWGLILNGSSEEVFFKILLEQSLVSCYFRNILKEGDFL